MANKAIPAILGILLLTAIQAPTLQGSPDPQYPTPNTGPISIIGDAGFSESGAVVSGSGTESDPYIIEGWVINAESSDGILIKDTGAHFLIRNCTV